MKKHILGTLLGTFLMSFFSLGYSAEIVGLGSGKCVDVAGYSVASGAAIIQWSCHGGSNQHWVLTSSGEIRGHGNKCLDVTGASTANGTPIILWDCHGGSNQKWYVYNGQIVSHASGKCLDVSGASGSDGASIIIWSCHGGANQKWNIH